MKAAGAILIAAGVVLSGCGGVQFPASSKPRDVNRPPSVQTTAPAPTRQATATPTGNVVSAPLRGSDPSFVSASAVTVGAGDTVYELSRRHRVPVPAIIRANDLQPPYLLQVGQRIELPRGEQHRVTQGDTLYSVAQRYDVGLYELARLNDVDAPYTIKLGEVLVIPEKDTPPVAPENVVVAETPPAGTATSPEIVVPKQIETLPPTETAGGQIALVPPKKPPSPVPPPPARTKSGFVWPVRGPLLSSFGAKEGGLRNDGINIKAPRGTAVKAAENGVVAYAGNEIRGFGNLLLIKHSDGYVTAYAHNDVILVKRGQKVMRGQKISTVGSTGSVSEPQLHFEIRKGRRPTDPKDYLTRTS